MTDVAIKIEGLKKQYRLGTIGGNTLSADLQSWWAKVRGREDPNSKIGENPETKGELFWALNGIDLEIKKGEAVGIIGHNGAGKSTLLKILSRVTAPTEGCVKMKGRVSSMLEVGTGFHPELTGRENIYMNGAILGMSKAEVDQKMEEIIDFSECRQFIDTPVKRYSSGMYVKLAFAVAAHLDAEIMIMDEVLAVGDVKFQKKCLGKMGDAANSEGKTVLYVSHNMNTIRQLCTRCIVLDHGRIVFDGDVEEAIALYIEQEKGELSLAYDFMNAKRPTSEHGRNLFVESLSYLNREKPIYKTEDRMVFEVQMSSKQNYESIGAYFTICFEDSTPIATTQSGIIGNIAAGQRKKMTFALDLPDLVEGVYYFYFDVYQGNEFGAINSLDRPMKKIYFQVLSDDSRSSIRWTRRYLGSIRMKPLEKISEQEVV